MSRLTRFALAGLVALAVMPLAAAGDIQPGDARPASTTWHKALLDMGNTWKKNTDGRVKLTVYAGGQQGDEATTVKKMRPGIAQAPASSPPPAWPSSTRRSTSSGCRSSSRATRRKPPSRRS